MTKYVTLFLLIPISFVILRLGIMRNRVYKTRRAVELGEIFWKRRPSEIRGYHRTLYVTTEDGDYLRVDYNIKEKRVRLYIEDVEEGGNPYYSVIANGKVVVERNATTGRVNNLYEKFNKRTEIFSSIPNNEVLWLINKNYGIAGSTSEVDSSERKRSREIERKKELERTRQKYFKPEEYPHYSIRPKEEIKERKIRMVDFFDFFIGALLCISLYIYDRNFVIVGILSAFIGIVIGFVDIFFRKRIPLFMKMIFFIIVGVASYIYGYYIL